MNDPFGGIAGTDYADFILRRHAYNIDMLKLTCEGNGVLLPVKVVPGASRTRFLGEWNGRARIAIAAPAEKGKANQILLSFLAERTGVRKGDVTIVAGHGSPTKTIMISGITADTLRAVLTMPATSRRQ